jgi:hypothetical protein
MNIAFRNLRFSHTLFQPLPRSHRGPEGRPLNVSPARKGWVRISIMIPSAIGAALMFLALSRLETAAKPYLSG